MLSALWEIANDDTDVKGPSHTEPVVSQFRLSLLLSTYHLQYEATQDDDPEHWEAISMAFLRSIQSGIFFDRKYWARNSKAGDALKPVYLSSIVMDDTAEELKRCASKFVRWRPKALILTSGKICQRSKPSDKGSRGIRQR